MTSQAARNPDREFTAWELAGEWWWLDRYQAVIVGGRAGYETATATRNSQVALRRADGLHRITRYVGPDTRMRLRPLGGDLIPVHSGPSLETYRCPFCQVVMALDPKYLDIVARTRNTPRTPVDEDSDEDGYDPYWGAA